MPGFLAGQVRLTPSSVCRGRTCKWTWKTSWPAALPSARKRFKPSQRTPASRTIAGASSARAKLAIEIFCYRARKYIGAYHTALQGADAVVFTGGIGENSPEVRQRICSGLECIGLSLDADRHQCLWAGGEVELTVTEFALLGALMGRPGKVYTRSELMDRAYGLGQVVTERTVDSHIRHIRRKLAEAGATNPIETVHGLGYRLRETPP